MAFSPFLSISKIAANARRRQQRLDRPSVDIEADRAGRRSTGDHRIDQVHVDRFFRA